MQIIEAYHTLFFLLQIDGLVDAQYLLPAGSSNISITFQTAKGLQDKGFECKIASFNLIFYTNASSFYIPVNLYDAKLKVLVLTNYLDCTSLNYSYYH